MTVFNFLRSALPPRTGAALLLTVLALSGCGNSPEGANQGDDLPPGARPMSAQVQNLVDRGNTAQREGRYGEALALYQEAMELAPDHPVPQFGGLMAAMALGDSALSASLSRELETSAPELLAMLNPDGGMGGGMPAAPHGGMGGAMPGSPPGVGSDPGALPPGHPTLGGGEASGTPPPDTSGAPLV